MRYDYTFSSCPYQDDYDGRCCAARIEHMSDMAACALCSWGKSRKLQDSWQRRAISELKKEEGAK